VAVNDSEVTHLPDSVELSDAAAIPLVSLATDQLVRHAANERKGQVAMITGASGGVGCVAVHPAKR
jgi:NADPH:quinone reductase-like Zn-dependent oxidoreductase